MTGDQTHTKARIWTKQHNNTVENGRPVGLHQHAQTSSKMRQPGIQQTSMIVWPNISKQASMTLDQTTSSVAGTMMPVSVAELATHCSDIRKNLASDFSTRNKTAVRQPKGSARVCKLTMEETEMRQAVPHVEGLVDGVKVPCVFINAGLELNLISADFVREEIQ